MIKEFNLLLSVIIYSSAECVVYTIIFIIIESMSYSFKTPTNERLYSNIKDEAVLEEIQRANSISEKLLISGRVTNEINSNRNTDLIEDGVTGLISKNDPVELATNINRIYKNEILRNQLLVTSLKKIKEFDLVNVEKIMRKIYRK